MIRPIVFQGDVVGSVKLQVGKLCSIAGATASTIQYVVNGVTANSIVFTLKKLCDALDITLSEFFDCPEFNDMDEEIE